MKYGKGAMRKSWSVCKASRGNVPISPQTEIMNMNGVHIDEILLSKFKNQIKTTWTLEKLADMIPSQNKWSTKELPSTKNYQSTNETPST